MVYTVILSNPTCVPYSGKMNDDGDSDDEKADDDGGNSNIESVPAQPPRAIIVTVVIAVPRLRIRNHTRLWHKPVTKLIKAEISR